MFILSEIKDRIVSMGLVEYDDGMHIIFMSCKNKEDAEELEEIQILSDLELDEVVKKADEIGFDNLAYFEKFAYLIKRGEDKNILNVDALLTDIRKHLENIMDHTYTELNKKCN